MPSAVNTSALNSSTVYTTPNTEKPSASNAADTSPSVSVFSSTPVISFTVGIVTLSPATAGSTPVSAFAALIAVSVVSVVPVASAGSV